MCIRDRYKVGGADGEVQTDQDYVARTVTDSEGRYWFEGLMEGYYVVEFDISNLKKQNGGGYTCLLYTSRCV